MAPHPQEESQPLTENSSTTLRSDDSLSRRSSSSSISTTSLVFEHLIGNNHSSRTKESTPYHDDQEYKDNFQELELDVEDGSYYQGRGVDPKYKKWLYIVAALCAIGWGLALAFFIVTGSYKHRSAVAHDPDITYSVGSGKKITIDQILSGQWYARSHGISWIEGPNGEDGLLLEQSDDNAEGFLVVEDVRSWEEDSKAAAMGRIVLMKRSGFPTPNGWVIPHAVWPSPDLKTVLVMSNRQKNWRHSFTGIYWLFDVATQSAQPLVPSDRDARLQLATWSPTSDAVVFTRDNNMFIRKTNKLDHGVTNPEVTQITTDGGEEMFNGVPDWVYEEEVFEGNSATWWSQDGKYIAFLATDESEVPEYPVEYFLSRPSMTVPDDGLENYPEVRKIKYPKAGAPNPTVHLRFYDVAAKAVFNVPIEDDFPDEDRLITEVIWAGQHGNVLIRETNRESDFLKMVLIDVTQRTGGIVRKQDVQALDGGWFEISETTTFIPSDPKNGRKEDGYIDTIIHEGYDHLAYFTPLNNSEPILLTSGSWEVVEAPSAVDVKKNLIYFQATKDGSTERHIYSVKLDGTDMTSITDVGKDGYHDASFSKGAGFVLLSYEGPNVPWQKVISTASNSMKFEHLVEENTDLAQRASAHEMPIKIYSTVNIDGVDLNVLERRPPHFDKNKKYPVLFYLYGGPGSQTVDKKFRVDFQSYVASNLEYIVVTVDGRGTGFIGRAARCIVRGNLGYWEAYDQIATAKIWAEKSYVDASRMAIWGWSYGGYMTLKTLEQDAGNTFRYGMAVAPVTDWHFYDTVYTERWMHTPQHNPDGYFNSSVHNTSALAQNTRFLLLHGVADDNVHFQNSLTLLDKLDLAGVENYDVHVFPDSDHSIYFHNANRMVWDKLSWWLINAMNGEWERIETAVPLRPGVMVGTE